MKYKQINHRKCYKGDEIEILFNNGSKYYMNFSELDTKEDVKRKLKVLSNQINNQKE